MCPEMQFKPRAVSPFPSCVILAKRCHHQLIQNFRLVSSDANLFSLKMKKKKKCIGCLCTTCIHFSSDSMTVTERNFKHFSEIVRNAR